MVLFCCRDTIRQVPIRQAAPATAVGAELARLFSAAACEAAVRGVPPLDRLGRNANAPAVARASTSSAANPAQTRVRREPPVAGTSTVDGGCDGGGDGGT